MSGTGADKLIESAQAALDNGDPANARARLSEALKVVPSDDAEQMTQLLQVAVEAATAAGEPAEALTLQLDVVRLVEAAGEPYEIGEEYERLAELHFERAKEDLTPESVMDADESYATAHEKYVEADGPNTTDALDALAGRLKVAHLGADIDGLGDRANEMAAIAPKIEGGPRVKKRVSEILDEGAALCREFGCDEEANGLGQTAADLMGRKYEPPPLEPLGGGGTGDPTAGFGGLAALLGGGEPDEPEDGEDDEGGEAEGLGGIDALLRAASGGGSERSDPGKKRSERLLDLLERAQSDGDLRVDAPRRISKLGELAQRYVQFVFEKNASVSDGDAAGALGLGATELQGAMASVDTLLDELLR